MASGATQATQATQQALHTQPTDLAGTLTQQFGQQQHPHLGLGTQPLISQAHTGAYIYPQVRKIGARMVMHPAPHQPGP
eukprot:1137047-Pelagomonas_calceolata.AAC.3